MKKNCIFIILPLFILVSCTVPIIDKEVEAFSSSVGNSTKQIETLLLDRSKSEKTEQLNKRINNLKSVYRLSPACSQLMLRGFEVKPTDCKLEKLYKTSAADKPTATKILSLLNNLKSYLLALETLASSEASSEVATSLAILIDSIDKFSDADSNDDLTKFAADLNDKKEASKKAASILVDQYKYRALRTAVSKAERGIVKISNIMIAYFDENPVTSSQDEFKKLRKSESQMVTARKSGSSKVYRQSVINFKEAFSVFISKEQKSPSHVIETIRNTHTALFKRLESPSDPEEIISLLESLKSLKKTYDE